VTNILVGTAVAYTVLMLTKQEPGPTTDMIEKKTSLISGLALVKIHPVSKGFGSSFLMSVIDAYDLWNCNLVVK